MEYDLILRRGHVIDPSQGIDRILDIGIQKGLIAELGENLPTGPGTQQIDVSGKYVCPGLIDLHGHWYEGSCFGIDPHICLNHGVTTVVDAGTTGFVNFPEFRRNRIDTARIQVLAFIHIGCLGLPTSLVGELVDLRFARPKETAAVIEKHRDITLGVKIRQGTMTGTHGLEALDLALGAAQASGLPLMVHISTGAKTGEILGKLRHGDVVTHCFQGRGDGIFSKPTGQLLPEVTEARKRGVIFDVGHGCGSFSWETARRAFQYSFYPDTISTDLHRFCVDRWAKSMPTTMSKFLHLGMSLEDVILKSTCAPAKAINRAEQLGTLRKETIADLFVFELQEGDFEFEDTHLCIEKGQRLINPHLVVKDGEPIEPGSYPASLRELYDCDQDVFRFVEETAQETV
ncbi:amidohydrolase/deacetylase family metallohydrolase [Acidobacteria bacterium AH-259-G07]|nr:amidohydrolase/deacetylase family metallohydrolase [Acidobacteria bacterium AH-259-G07]